MKLLKNINKNILYIVLAFLFLNLISGVVMPLYQQKKTDKIVDLRISMEAEKLHRKRLQMENETLIRSHYKLLKELNLSKNNYQNAKKNINFSDIPYDSVYIYVTDYLSGK